MAKESAPNPKDVGLQASRPLLKTISLRDYKPDAKVINRALWGSDEAPSAVPEQPENPLPEKK